MECRQPFLYTLLIHCGDEYIKQQVGFREICVRDGIVYLNGKKVRMNGVNRHDSDPFTGYTISQDQAMADLRMMKQSNINAIRTSHYPNSPWFPELCDELGFYLVAESDLEAHGCVNLIGGEGGMENYGKTVQNPIFREANYRPHYAKCHTRPQPPVRSYMVTRKRSRIQRSI